MELTSRKKKILQAVVESYVQSAEPVGSQALAGRGELNVSPATLRHEMAELEALGYLEHPHTSAGRIPTPLGYRLFVNELMNRHRLAEAEREALDAVTRMKQQKIDRLLLEAGDLLSSLTQYPSYALALRSEAVRLLRLDLFATALYTFVIVLVSDTHEIKNKVVRHKAEVVDEILRALALHINHTFVRRNIFDISESEWSELERDVAGAAEYSPAVRLFFHELRDEHEEREAILTGQSRLLDHPEYRDIAKARSLLEYLSDRRELARLAPPSPSSAVQFIIGPENVAEQLQNASVVVTSYPIGDGIRGLIGIIGPTRMDYAKLTSRLSYFAGRLGDFLASGEDLPGKDE